MRISSLFIGLMVLLAPVISSAATDYYLQIDGVEGESTRATTSSSAGRSAATTRATINSSVEGDMELKRAEGDESAQAASAASASSGTSGTNTKGGKVEYEWKVEEGESMSAKSEGPDSVAVPDEPQRAQVDYFLKIDGVEGESDDTKGGETGSYDTLTQEQASNFAILLSGGNDETSQEAREEVADILFQAMQEADMPIESVSLNFEKITMTTRHSAKLFGFIPMDVDATVEIDAESNVKVKFPWWSIIMSGKSEVAVREQAVGALSNALKAKHDTAMNAIRNMK